MQHRHKQADVSKVKGEDDSSHLAEGASLRASAMWLWALCDRAKGLAEQQRANPVRDYTDGLVAVEAGQCLLGEGMQQPLARTGTSGCGHPTTPSGWQATD